MTRTSLRVRTILALAGSMAAGATALAQAPGASLSNAQTLFEAAAALPPAAERSILAQADKPAAPGSRDELFGLKPTPGQPALAERKATVTGFYDLEVAYTYSDPSHWSRAVNRLQLSAQGEFGGGVKWKIGGRGDLDPVYMTSDFYLSDVKNNQRANAFWRETYLDFSAAGWDFRVGAQNIVWGDVVGFFVADVVSARDLREFLLPSFDIIRAPQWAVRAEYFKGDSHLELIWIPYPTYDNIGKPGSDFYPFPLPSPTTKADAAPFANPNKPPATLGNSSYGVRGNTLLGGWDLAAFYYRSYSRQPTFYTLPGPSASLPVIIQPLYDRIWQVGGTVNKDFGPVVLHAEAVYTSGQNYASTDPTAPQGVLERNTFDWVVGADFTPWRDARLNLQVFQRIYDGSAKTLVIQTGDFGASVQLAAKITAAWEPQILYMQLFGGGGGLIRPRLNWYPMRNTTVGFGVDIFTGPDDGFFGRYNNRDRVYTEVRLDF